MVEDSWEELAEDGGDYISSMEEQARQSSARLIAASRSSMSC